MSNKIRSRQYADVRGAVIEGHDGNIIIAEGDTKPTDGGAGFAPGCLFFLRAGVSNTICYQNTGTATSCTFVALSTGGLDFSGLLATAAEVNRNNKASTRVVAAGAASLTVTQALHDGKTILLDQATGVAVTLPAMTGTGARYRFVCSVATAGGSHVITATGAHLYGTIFMGTDTTVTSLFTAVCAENVGGSTVITINGSTTGGKLGDWFEIEDVATSKGMVRGMLVGTGTEATPFS